MASTVHSSVSQPAEASNSLPSPSFEPGQSRHADGNQQPVHPAPKGNVPPFNNLPQKRRLSNSAKTEGDFATTKENLAPSAADPDSDNDDDKADQRNREKLLAEGEKRMKESLNSGGRSLERPENIDKLWRQAYPLVRQWWKGGFPETHKNSIQTINDKIKKEVERLCENQLKPQYDELVAKKKEEGKGDEKQCHERALDELQRKFQFPDKEIHGHIIGIGTKLETIKSHNQDEDVRRETTDLIRGIVVFQEKMKVFCIPPQNIVANNALEEFERFINKEETKKEYDEYIALLKEPTIEENEILEVTAPEMKRFMQLAQPNAMVHDDEPKDIRAKCQGYNNSLVKLKDEVPYSHDLAIGILPWIETAKSAENDKGVKDYMKALIVTWVDQGLHEFVKNVFEGIMDVEEVLRETPRPKSVEEVLRETPSPEENTELVYSKGVIEVLSYDDGITEYGELEAIRLSKNPNFSRYIVNAGTEQQPFFRVVRATDLGPGGSEKLAQNSEKYVNFDLAIRKKTGKHCITSCGPCVELPFVKSHGKRRPDWYTKVTYREGIAGLPPYEWLTRTEFRSFVGKAWAEKQEAIMMKTYRENKAMFESCRCNGIHPDTKNPLEEADRKKHPWLFPEA